MSKVVNDFVADLIQSFQNLPLNLNKILIDGFVFLNL